MKAKDIIIIVLLLALAVVSYALGYRNGKFRDIERREAAARLSTSLLLYAVAEKGDMGKLRSDLGIVVLGQTRTFEERYGVPHSDDWFAERFAHAQTIATQIESRLVRFNSPRDFIHAIEKTNAAPK